MTPARPASDVPAPPIDPALRRFVEALATADARRDYRAAKAREALDGDKRSD